MAKQAIKHRCYHALSTPFPKNELAVNDNTFFDTNTIVEAEKLTNDT